VEIDMRQEYNIYCDESCHLEHDKEKAMVLGSIWVSKDQSSAINTRIREIKIKHSLKSDFEIKWHKVGDKKISFYEDLIDYFFDDDHLHYRALVIPDKSKLNHSLHNQTHDDFYYKMYFDLLKVILDPECAYNIYLDIKDTRSQQKVLKLQDVLRNSHYDFSKQIIKKIQQVHSHEIEILQITDLLTGALSYLHRGLNTSSAKLKLIERIKERSKYSLMHSTLYRESKMNIFIWKARLEVEQ
jgi:hypothetical protein